MMTDISERLRLLNNHSGTITRAAADTIDAQAATIKALVEALEKVLVEYDKLDNIEPASMTSAYFEAKKAITAAEGLK